MMQILGPMKRRLGAIPIVVAGDFNTTTSCSPSLQEALSNGWSDSAELQARSSGTPACDTCFHGTPSRIDLILTNPVATHALCSVRAFWTGFATHKAVEATLCLDAFKQCNPTFSIPRAIPTEGLKHSLDASRLTMIISTYKLDDSPRDT